MKQTSLTEHFTWHDAFFLPSWGIYHSPSTIEIVTVTETCRIMEKIRDVLGSHPVNVHCMVRPNSVNCVGSKYHGKDYNAAIGSTAVHSPHILGMACDFDVESYQCDEVRRLLLGYLEEFQIRMEDTPQSLWVHIDTYKPAVSGGARFFKP